MNAAAYDVIVVGSGASGGWVAKRLCEAGVHVALLDAGRAHTPADHREHMRPFDLEYRDRAPELIRRKIMRPTTDSLPGVDFDNLGPGVQNLLTIFKAFTGWSDEQVRSHFAGMRYGELKKTVAEAVVAGLEPIQLRYREITAEPGYLKRVLRESAERVAPIANSTVRLVKERMGIYTD